jgi:hypothetical protein
VTTTMLRPAAGPSVRDAMDALRRAAQRTREYDFSIWFWGDAIAVDGSKPQRSPGTRRAAHMYSSSLALAPAGRWNGSIA